MSVFLKYFWYILRHKWFVFVECCKLGIPLAGITHDLSKFLPDEFFGYANFYFNDKKKANEWYELTGIYGYIEAVPYGLTVSDQFNIAWNHHQKRNPHHWEYWMMLPSLANGGEAFPLPMPDRYLREMLADWRGAGRAKGMTDTKGWYLANKDKICLRNKDRKWIEQQLGIAE